MLPESRKIKRSKRNKIDSDKLEWSKMRLRERRESKTKKTRGRESVFSDSLSTKNRKD